MEPRVIAIANMKGGVGKTGTTVHLAMQLAFEGRRVLLIDLDGQANASDHFRGDFDEARVQAANSYHYLTERLDAEECIYNTAYHGLKVMPATLDVAMAGFEMMGKNANAVLEIRADLHRLPFDFILIDTPPSQVYSIKAGIYAADLVISPTDARTDSLKGMNMIAGLIDHVLFPDVVNLKKPVRLVLPCNVTENEALKLRSILEEQEHAVCGIDILKSRPFDTTMVKKVPLDRPGKNIKESQTVSEFEKLSREVA